MPCIRAWERVRNGGASAGFEERSGRGSGVYPLPHCHTAPMPTRARRRAEKGPREGLKHHLVMLYTGCGKEHR